MYTVTITSDNQACSSVQMVTLTVPEEIDLSVSDDLQVCENQLLDITATTNVDVTFEWTLNGTDPAGSDATIQASTGRPNVYAVVATDEFGCSVTDQVTLANFEVLVALDANEEVLCLGDQITLELDNALAGSDILTFEWIGDDLDLTDPSAPIANPSESTLYQVIVTNQFGCTNTEFIDVDVVDIDLGLGDALADPDTIFIGNSTQLAISSIDDLNFVWSNGNTLDDENISDPLASPEEDIEYTVTVTDENGCITTRTVPVVVLSRACDEPFIFFPNAFSPNDDGENDMLRVRARDAFVDEVYWIVYSRWGERVFESNSLNEVWDGRHNGELVSPDSYGYYLRVNCIDGEVFEKRGNVTVLR